MVAFDGKDPVAVLVGCKRPPVTLVHRIAVHPGHLRRGHGRHLLTSLSAKLAILGPPQLRAEVPADNAPARALFAACGWREDRVYRDLVLDAPSGSPAPGAVLDVTVDDLLDVAFPSDDAARSWERTRGTLLKRRERLLGLAIASGERLEASALYTREAAHGAAIWSLHAAGGGDGPRALAVLVRELAHCEGGRLTIPRVHEDEVALDVLGGLGFRIGREFAGLASEAQSRA